MGVPLAPGRPSGPLKFGLELHEGKTRLIEFGRFAIENRAERDEGKPDTFDFLGFTHICAKKRDGKRFALRRKTIAKKMRAKIAEVSKLLMRGRHKPLPEQGSWLKSVVRGHFNYYGVPGNRKAMDAFRTLINRAWIRALRKRCQKARSLTWAKIADTGEEMDTVSPHSAAISRRTLLRLTRCKSPVR